jgi:hypothetical protein
MRRLIPVSLLLLAACGAATVNAQTLALAYKGGDTYKYALHSTAKEAIDMGSMSIPVNLDLTAVETVTVKSVDSSGTADLSIEMSNVVIKSLNGQTTNSTTGTPVPGISMKVGADGRIVSVNGTTFGGAGGGGNPLALSGGGLAFISAVLPDAAVKPGDTWSKDFDQGNSLGTGGVHVTTKSRYLRNEPLKGVSAAVVETTTTSTIDITLDIAKAIAGAPVSGMPNTPAGSLPSASIKGTTTSVVTSWIDPNGHRVMKSHKTGTTNTTVNFTGGQAIPGLTGPISTKGADTLDLSPA